MNESYYLTFSFTTGFG